jgi:hypothetical protein
MEYTIKHFVKGHCTGSDTFRGFGLDTVTRQALRAFESGHTDRTEVLDCDGTVVARFPLLGTGL